MQAHGMPLALQIQSVEVGQNQIYDGLFWPEGVGSISERARMPGITCMGHFLICSRSCLHEHSGSRKVEFGKPDWTEKL